MSNTVNDKTFVFLDRAGRELTHPRHQLESVVRPDKGFGSVNLSSGDVVLVTPRTAQNIIEDFAAARTPLVPVQSEYCANAHYVNPAVVKAVKKVDGRAVVVFDGHAMVTRGSSDKVFRDLVPRLSGLACG